VREQFKEYSPQSKTQVVIDRANAIIDEYARLGFKLTLRQLYYQFVARALFEENTLQQYRRLGATIRDARNGGLIDWEAIEDRTREVNTHNSWDGPASIIEDAAQWYQEDLWRHQVLRPEVWIEKEALLGVIEDICTEFRVPFYAQRGNDSSTLQYQAGRRFARFLDLGLKPLVLHLADHDPNGIDMTRDNQERLALYARHEIEVRRIGLNMDQVRGHQPPANFAKETDARTPDYVKRFGTEKCWELDALSPTVIADLIRAEIEPMIDRAKWRRAEASERRGQKHLAAVAANWTKVEKMLAISKRKGGV
jgi:hypothetical protein